ncbi:YolD-like family protein [Bacillus sp. FJAT-22090]|uniref:YolD-like family protein n=1 Tax=Bacillus sp. FJAT-22090 TaxID=1581038 RepID=UPI0011A4CC57|nr:YolD-like family protein [Bacillus sp. FJAT-22090]
MASFEEEWGRLDLSKVRDRGSKKWVAMMLPEHVKMIRDYNDEVKKAPIPDLNVFDYEAIQEQIELAMKRNVEIHIKRWKNGEFFYNNGTIQWIDLSKRTIELEDSSRSYEFPLDEIVDVAIME